MKITTKTHYACDYCPKVYHRGADMVAHERHCWHNPSRIPRDGELHGMAHRAFFGDRVPPWCPPNVGVIYLDDQWVEVPGYQLLADARTLAQLRAGHDLDPACVERWPEPGMEGSRLTSMRRADRIAFVLRLLAGEDSRTPEIAMRISRAELLAELDRLDDTLGAQKGSPCLS